MSIPGGEGYGVLVIVALIATIVIPFLIGFIIIYFILSFLFSNKKGKLYIKTKDKRLIALILISAISGFLCILILGNLFGDIGTYIIKSLSY